MPGTKVTKENETDTETPFADPSRQMQGRWEKGAGTALIHCVCVKGEGAASDSMNLSRGLFTRVCLIPTHMTAVRVTSGTPPPRSTFPRQIWHCWSQGRGRYPGCAGFLEWSSQNLSDLSLTLCPLSWSSAEAPVEQGGRVCLKDR